MYTTSVPDYSAKGDEELLALASNPAALTLEAHSALVSELKKRSLDAPTQLDQFKEEQRKSETADDVSRARQPLLYGMGCKIFGRGNVELVGTAQEYDATIFVVVFYFPIIPLGTYRFTREQGDDDVQVLRKTPLNWVQVALVWAKSLAVVVGLLVLFPILVRAKW